MCQGSQWLCGHMFFANILAKTKNCLFILGPGGVFYHNKMYSKYLDTVPLSIKYCCLEKRAFYDPSARQMIGSDRTLYGKKRRLIQTEHYTVKKTTDSDRTLYSKKRRLIQTEHYTVRKDDWFRQNIIHIVRKDLTDLHRTLDGKKRQLFYTEQYMVRKDNCFTQNIIW